MNRNSYLADLRDPKTGEPESIYSTEYRKWAAAQEKTVISDDDANLIEQLDFSVRNHAHARSLLAEGVPQGVVRTEFGGIHCQAQIDWLSPRHGIVGVVFLDRMKWVEHELRHGIVHRLAFQSDLITQMIEKQLPIHVVVLEKSIPQRCGVWQISPRLLRKARKQNLATLAQFKQCLQSDRWPSGYEEVRILKPAFI